MRSVRRRPQRAADGAGARHQRGTEPVRLLGSVRLVTLPNSWSHVNADYVMTTRLTPVDVRTTDVDVVFLVREGAVEGVDYTAADVDRVWVSTSEEDWALCEANAAGIPSRAYRPGPLSPVTENSVAQFHAWWLRRLSLEDVADPCGHAA